MFYLYLLLLLLLLLALGGGLWHFSRRLNMLAERRILMVAILMTVLASTGFYWVLKASELEEDPTVAIVRNKQENSKSVQGVPVSAGELQQRNANNTNTVTPLPVNTEVAPLTQAPLEQPDAMPAEQAIVREKTDRELLEEFEQRHFPGLFTQRVALYQALQNTQGETNAVVKAVSIAPKQRELLRRVYQLRKQHYEILEDRYHEVNKHLLEFWAHYRTGDSNYTTTVFEPVAERLQRNIKTILAEKREFHNKERKIVDAYLAANERFLKQDQPLRLSRQAAAARHYGGQTRAALIRWLASSQNLSLSDVPELNIKLEHLLTRRATINNSLRKLKQYMQEYTALKPRLEKTLQQWGRALSANYLAESRLLSSIELFYLKDNLNLQASERLLNRLRNLLSGGAQNLVEQAEVQYLKALEAYRPKISLAK